jgi:hypothetical protein
MLLKVNSGRLSNNKFRVFRVLRIGDTLRRLMDDHDGCVDVSGAHIVEEGRKSRGQQSQSCDFART